MRIWRGLGVVVRAGCCCAWGDGAAAAEAACCSLFGNTAFELVGEFNDGGFLICTHLMVIKTRLSGFIEYFVLVNFYYSLNSVKYILKTIFILTIYSGLTILSVNSFQDWSLIALSLNFRILLLESWILFLSESHKKEQKKITSETKIWYKKSRITQIKKTLFVVNFAYLFKNSHFIEL